MWLESGAAFWTAREPWKVYDRRKMNSNMAMPTFVIVAVVFGACTALSPGEQAIFPVVWSR
jgi:hypothetical protein